MKTSIHLKSLSREGMNMNWFQELQLALELVTVLQAAYAEIEAGQTAVLPPFATYIGGKHVNIDITVAPFA